MTTISPLFIALIVTFALSRGMLRWAPRLGLLDRPAARKPHARRMPVGGPALVFGVLAGWGAGVLIAQTGASLELGSWILGALLVALLGLLDDRRELSPDVKLLGQAVAALLPLLGGNVVYSVELAGMTLPLGLLAAPLTLLWIVGVTNALNLSDGLDGLAGGLSAIVALACIALSAQTGNGEALILALALLGSALGFLALNAPPARLFLGDGGSYFLGFLLAGLVLAAPQPRWGAFEGVPLVVPIALLGYPLADTLWAVIRRLRAGRSIFEPDDRHLHHGLWRALGDERKAVWALWGLSSLLAALALALALFSAAGPGRS